ncbi:spore germination protein [Alkalihalobacillus sp. MEB130]|uniref:spore germination protein n=1 Tax=Alkalihalobacillus sp. MEB130 TaxID=2976704 RepID=UPI0028DE9695|nr:spore germination protein [Alkalihalobacillus sp. MEB130]MDT8861186.1 spore germination protein [Alkalihalobacillus sp. MEB130]
MKVSNNVLYRELGLNIKQMKEIFTNSTDVIFRTFHVEDRNANLIYVDGLVNTSDIQNHVLHEIIKKKHVPNVTFEDLEQEVISLSDIKESNTFDEIVSFILDGNAVVLIDQYDKALVLPVSKFETRSISEPESESAIRGPREGFIENIRVNTSLVRRKIKTPNLKISSKKLGEQTQTSVEIAYIDGIVDKKVLEEVENRLNRIEIDGILETGYIEELIEDNPWSLFPQIQISERPDTVAANLLEGRIALFVDGTPFVMVLPATFWQQFQASEDYYDRFYIAIFLRIIRFLFLAIALTLPALYVATTTYHHEMIPTKLLLSIAASREAIPFPAIVEAFIMEISFEALREAGVRLPKTIGMAVSILGALVIGSAAVEAGIVSAPMVIVVSLTGIASFTIPKFSLAIAVRLLRFPLMILGAIFGMLGIVIGMVLIVAHLCKMRSFGVPYFEPLAPMKLSQLKDVFIRVPIWMYEKRPSDFVKSNVRKQSDHLKPSPSQQQE